MCSLWLPHVTRQMYQLKEISSKILRIMSASTVATASVIRVRDTSRLTGRGGTINLFLAYRGVQTIIPRRPVLATICGVTRGNH